MNSTDSSAVPVAGEQVRPVPDTALEQAEWQEREARHHARVDTLLAGHLARRKRGEPHPVEDFLFSYYSYKPSRLRHWHPGAGAVLMGEAARQRLSERYYTESPGGGVTLDTAAFRARRGATADFIAALLRATDARPAHAGCFGLHEWAMVYRSGSADVRHAGVALRLGHEGTDRVVEAHRIRCTHYDAFRFFTEDARPRNQVRPERAQQVELEQPGCLHANMDCYKWAYKLAPAVPSELLADCFELARDIRELDMRASPYDLRAHGYTSVPIETQEGKADYVAAQRRFAERARALREQLLAVCEPLTEGGPSAQE